MPPARFELTAPGLGILCSILLSYGGTLNISYLRYTFSPLVSKLCHTVPYNFLPAFNLRILDQLSEVAHVVLFFRLIYKVGIDSHGDFDIFMPEIL